jgi:putative ABC transport system permease protein
MAMRFLQFFLRPELKEEVMGDLKERFDEDVELYSLSRARLRYWMQVIHYLRPFAIRRNFTKSYNHLPMLRYDLKTSWRNLSKQKGFAMINIGGLAIGIASFLFLIAYVTFQKSYENFHKNAGNIFRITMDLYRGDEYLMTDCEVYAPFAPLAKERMPEVLDFVRMMNNDNRRIKIGDKQFLDEQSYFADSTAFSVFTFKPLYGSLQHALAKPFEAVLTETAAKRYFGVADARDKLLEADGSEYVVVAVIEDVPFNTHLKFDFLLSHVSVPVRSGYRYSDENWETGNNEYTYLLMAPGTDLKSFNQKLVQLSTEFKDEAGGDRFVAEPISDIHLYSHKTFEPDANGSANVVNAMFVVAFFILALAWVNYINLSTAKALERAREVGGRKVLGSSYGQLISQFLTESLVINVAASALAFVLVRLSLPYFQSISGMPTLAYFSSELFWYTLSAVVVVGVFFSGLYPAFVLSSFQPVSVLKGRFRNSIHGQWVRKGLVVFQFSSTAVLMICLSVIFYQMKFLKDFDLGMNISQALILNAPELDSLYAKRFETFRNALMQHPGVRSVAQSNSIPAASRNEISTTQSIFRVGEDRSSGSFNYYHYGIDEAFLETFGMQLIAGSNFRSGDKERDVVLINEEASKSLGFSSPAEAIGSKITYRAKFPGEDATVIGVIRDFNQWSPKEAKLPMIFRYASYPRYISLNVETAKAKEVIQFANKQWSSVFGSNPFSYFFLDERYNEQYKVEEQFSNVLAVFAVLAIVIASLGLFGLSAYTALQRTKEIGIRKALGGSVPDIIRLLSGDFVRLVIIASIIATPIAYLLCVWFLQSYASRITLGLGLFIIPLLTVFAIALLTISLETFKAARTNPVNVLRSE